MMFDQDGAAGIRTARHRSAAPVQDAVHLPVRLRNDGSASTSTSPAGCRFRAKSASSPAATIRCSTWAASSDGRTDILLADRPVGRSTKSGSETSDCSSASTCSTCSIRTRPSRSSRPTRATTSSRSTRPRSIAGELDFSSSSRQQGNRAAIRGSCRTTASRRRSRPASACGSSSKTDAHDGLSFAPRALGPRGFFLSEGVRHARGPVRR